MKTSGLSGVVLGLCVLIAALVFAANPPGQLLAALGLWGDGRTMKVPAPQPGKSVWRLVGGIGLVLGLAVIFPPLAWLVLAAAFAYLLIGGGLLQRIIGNAQNLPSRGGGS